MEEHTTDSGGAREHAASGCFFCETALPFLKNCWPEHTREHFRASRIEFLKGIRSLIDNRIAHLSKEEPKGTHVTVE